jgi:hypothetical protein
MRTANHAQKISWSYRNSSDQLESWSDQWGKGGDRARKESEEANQWSKRVGEEGKERENSPLHGHW